MLVAHLVDKLEVCHLNLTIHIFLSQHFKRINSALMIAWSKPTPYGMAHGYKERFTYNQYKELTLDYKEIH